MERRVLHSSSRSYSIINIFFYHRYFDKISFIIINRYEDSESFKCRIISFELINKPKTAAFPLN